MGWEQVNGSETVDPINAGWFNLKWKDLITKGVPEGCIGGAFFEYMDEPYTKVDPKQQSLGIVTSIVATTASPPGQTIPTVTTFPVQTGYTRAPPPVNTYTNGNTNGQNTAQVTDNVPSGTRVPGPSDPGQSQNQNISGATSKAVCLLLVVIISSML